MCLWVVSFLFVRSIFLVCKEYLSYLWVVSFVLVKSSFSVYRRIFSYL